MSLPRNQPLVSVCIPAYNGMAYLKDCLDSLLAQSFRDFELLIVDDASTDGTPEFVRQYLRREPRLRFYRNRANLGLVPNWSRCVRLARGEWLKFVFENSFLNMNVKFACLKYSPYKISFVFIIFGLTIFV